ncbi:MAG: hypothetical protein NTY07_10065 [Bacteroidia bacterium]|nr:hypothetical protein [Bacteroidia bacterium]
MGRKTEDWYFSIIDVIEILTDTDRSRKYWSDLKKKLQKEGSELSEIIGQLKMVTKGQKKLTMILEKNYLYHIYNQGNNRQKIFFSRDNYLYFLEKVNKLLLPYVDVIAWCLMPNHFHFLVYVKEFELEVADSDGLTPSEAVTKVRTINDSIGLLLLSYTRAINKQEKMSGSLFRNPTKAECITKLTD